MARASTKSPARAEAAKAESAIAKENPGRSLLELRLRWKIINETVEAGMAERKRLREAIDALTKEIQQHKDEE